MRILGFDPSLNSSGYAHTDSLGNLYTGRIRPKKLRETERLDFILKSFKGIVSSIILKDRQNPLIVYENYSMGIKGQMGRFFSMGELGGILKLYAYTQGIDILLAPPTSLKLFATGKGNADKEKVMKAVANQWGFETKYNDEADSFTLMKMGEAYLNPRLARKGHKKRAINGCIFQKSKFSK